MVSNRADSIHKGGSMEHVEGPHTLSTDKYKRNVNAKSVALRGLRIRAVSNR